MELEPLRLRSHLPEYASRATRRCVLRADSSLVNGDAARALREIDHAWRSVPEDAALLAPIYARLLVHAGHDDLAALRLLERAAAFGPDPELAALAVRSLWRLRQRDEAVLRLQEALCAFSVEPGEPLAQIAAEILRDTELSVSGWVGLTRSRDFVGQCSPHLHRQTPEIDASGHALPQGALQEVNVAGERYFRLRLPDTLRGEAIQFKVGGVTLIGSGHSASPDFALDGRAQSVAGSISGWARIGWIPTMPVRLRIEDDDRHCVLVRSAQLAWPISRWPFKLELRASGLCGGRFHISAGLPDGREQMLPDTPLLLESAVRLPHSAWHANRRSSRQSPRHVARDRPDSSEIDVIVPVYGAREETLACLDSLLPTLGEHGRAIVVDDGSEDAVLASALDQYAARRQIVLLRNEGNLGFVRSVNRALTLHPTADAVLLNSDALVFGDWLQRLRVAAYLAPDIGTVTPFINNGSIASYPSSTAPAIDAAAAAALHEIAARENAGGTAEIPVGVGCCIYLRRDCLQDVGTFDAEVFGKGYGEETDFCLRALARGWKHRLAADVFVFHAGGRSFGSRRAALLERSQRLLRMRHSGFDRLLAEFGETAPLHKWRRRLDEGRLSSFDGKFVLLVTLALPGGVDRFAADRCRAARARGMHPLVLRPTDLEHPQRFELWTDALPLGDLRYAVSEDLAPAVRLLGSLSIDHIEIQHFLGLDHRIVEAIIGLELPYDVYLHDYVWICPRVTLIDGTGRYCGEPDVRTCEACVRKNGSHLPETISVAALRIRSARWLHAARAVIAPTRDVLSRYQRYFPDLTMRIDPFGPALSRGTPRPVNAAPRIRVALIGALGEHKGYRVLLACARDAARRQLPLEYVVIGYTERDAPLVDTGKVFVTGRYSEGEAPYLLRREQPHLALVPSVWPETWCFALDYVVSAGLPVLAFDLGAIPERLRAAGLGVFLPLGCKAREINDCILSLAQTNKEKQVMNQPETSSQNQRPGGLSAGVQVLPLTAGLYLFSVNSAAPKPVPPAGNLMLPAVHVGLGPGVRADQVEFVSGPTTQGTWLFAPDNMLVVRVNSGGAMLVLTSIRAPDGELLSIKVERLEERTAPQTQPSPAPARVGVPADVPPAEKASPSPADGSIPLQVSVHVRTRGDQTFTATVWAGRTGPGLWIESFALKPLKQFDAHDIEYKGLTASGFETPWLSDGIMCGTKGMSVPLIGFAVRLKPGEKTGGYECEYSGYFQAGGVSGPGRNGTPCRSNIANDPLEGLQVRIFKRAGSVLGRKRATLSAPAPRDMAPAPALGSDRDTASSTQALVRQLAPSAGAGRARGTRSAAPHAREATSSLRQTTRRSRATRRAVQTGTTKRDG